MTARHNIERARKSHQQLCVRVNRTDGTAAIANVDVDIDWYVDEADPGNDVAITQVYLEDTDADLVMRPIPRTLFATEAIVNEHGIGIGDELGAIGLFAKRAGAHRNEPIVRSGTLAAMPGEPLTNGDTGARFTAYLMELRSIGGLSGSPVFVYLGPPRQKGPVKMEWRFFLLGVLHGHWEVRSGEYLSMADSREVDQPLNLGIGVVIPTSYLDKLIDAESAIKQRREMASEISESGSGSDGFG